MYTDQEILSNYYNWVEWHKSLRWDSWLDEQPLRLSKSLQELLEEHGNEFRDTCMENYGFLPIGSVLSVAPPVGEHKRASLMGMPAEVRNGIWRLTLTVPTGQDGTVLLMKEDKRAKYAEEVNDTDDSFKKNLHLKQRPGPSVLSLLLTCRRIYHESAAMFYHYNELRTNVESQWLVDYRPSIKSWAFPHYQSPERLIGVQSLTVKLNSHHEFCELLKTSQWAIDPRCSGLNRFPSLKKLVFEYDLEYGFHSIHPTLEAEIEFPDLKSAFKGRAGLPRVYTTAEYLMDFHKRSKHGNLGRLDIFVKELWGGQVVCTSHSEKLLGWTNTTTPYEEWYERSLGTEVSGPLELHDIMTTWDVLTGDLLVDDDDGYLAAILDAVKLPEETTNATNTDSRKRKRDCGAEEMFPIIRPRKSAKLD